MPNSNTKGLKAGKVGDGSPGPSPWLSAQRQNIGCVTRISIDILAKSRKSRVASDLAGVSSNQGRFRDAI